MSVVLNERWADDPRIAVVTINRPKVLNALSGEVMGELTRIFAELEADSTVKPNIRNGPMKNLKNSLNLIRYRSVRRIEIKRRGN